jgi:hypothetical protein
VGEFEDQAAALQARFEKGAKGALARMILLCASVDKPLPAWAANAFIAGFSAIIKGETRSWDETLGRPYPKGKHLVSVRMELQAHDVYHRVRAIHENEGVPVGDALFERVARELGKAGSKSTVARLYARVKYSMSGLQQI